MEKLGWEPADGEYGRITKGFCKAFLAELYMYQKKFTEAKKELNDIITSNTYALEPCYANLHAWDNHWTKESIFEVAYHIHGNMEWERTVTMRQDMVWLYVCRSRVWRLGVLGSVLGVLSLF